MDEEVIFHIGIDDIDTPYGGCTTHYASLLLAETIKSRDIELIDYPNLIRLNPGVPWKTRGNGGVALRFHTKSYDKALDLFEYAISFLDDYVREYGRWREHSQPSIILYYGEVNELIEWFSRKALYDLIPLDLLYRVLDKIRDNTKYYVTKGKGRGLIGGLASIGYRMLDTDYTYELLAYRSLEYLGTERRVEWRTIREMDNLYSEETILNYDYEEDKPLIIPHGPDPVLLGIRGEGPNVLIKAFNKLIIHEPVPLRIIYRTNQHTDAHLKVIPDLSEAYIYRSVRVRVKVSSKPHRVIGGHVIFKATDGFREIDVAVYEPTGHFRDIVEKLEVGDEIEVMGVIRPHSSRHGK
ncbi:MAG: tRNA(Ile2) 2-agmatinylcytidine synthetase, partial [Desulfurococcales archaeon ex4484_58]